MDKQEAVEKLVSYLDSITVDRMFRNTTTYRDMLTLNIQRQIRESELKNPKEARQQGFEIERDEPGVFIFYNEYLGYYCYDYGFYFRIPTSKSKYQPTEPWFPENARNGIKKIYNWGYPYQTYDITSLVMKTFQMPYMNWKRPPF